ncbi:hypothetical protein GCM10010339_92710 [Streptomyces alanosinicus]|uniref:Uncharacterized protein n=1 Tax=Streptomyces alanosinicus TaxID=68171 RepID=A0A918YUF6_9ACTN|nr:hypothetical protein GCM10010339_92710 [Streptomyces alanosinicus]
MRVAEQWARGRIEAEPADGEDARHMAVRDDGDVAAAQQRADAVQHRAGARGYLRELLAWVVGVAWK